MLIGYASEPNGVLNPTADLVRSSICQVLTCFMFDTEKFILEVHSRECIWNGKIKEYSDRNLRREAWEDIALIMHEDYGAYGTKKKNQTIQLLQKKWKHLRDYFVREKNKEQNSIGAGGAMKKRKSPLLDMLQFLQSPRKNRLTTLNIPPAPRACSLETSSGTNDEDNHCSNPNMNEVPVLPLEQPQQASNAKTNEKGLILFEECVLNAIAVQEQNNKNPHLNFFLSLLPEMQTMTDRQVFELKFEIMRLIQKIKYNNVSL